MEYDPSLVVPSASERVFKVNKKPKPSKTVSLEEAVKNMNKATKKPSPQQNLDDIPEGKVIKSKQREYDPFTGNVEEPEEDFRPGIIKPGAEVEPTPYPEKAPTPSNTYGVALSQKTVRFCLGLKDGDMYLSALEIIPDKYSVTILLPLSTDGAIFTPKPGTELTVTVGDKSYECYYPGARFESSKYGIIGMIFIRKDEQ